MDRVSKSLFDLFDGQERTVHELEVDYKVVDCLLRRWLIQMDDYFVNNFYFLFILDMVYDDEDFILPDKV